MEITIPLYPVLIIVWTLVLAYVIGLVHKINLTIHKLAYNDLKDKWKLVNKGLYPAEMFADHLKDMEEFLIEDNKEFQDLLVNILIRMKP